jgi:hypothetical protein
MHHRRISQSGSLSVGVQLQLSETVSSVNIILAPMYLAEGCCHIDTGELPLSDCLSKGCSITVSSDIQLLFSQQTAFAWHLEEIGNGRWWQLGQAPLIWNASKLLIFLLPGNGLPLGRGLGI